MEVNVNSNTIEGILRVGQQIIGRKWCSERDIVYHIIAPMLVYAGWHPTEMYFEKWENGSAPDISLIPEGMDHPVLTVEAKAQNKDVGTFHKGWSRLVTVGEKRRDDVVLQVFQQLTNVGRQSGRKFALLTNGISFGLFSAVEIGPQSHSIICLDATTLSQLSSGNSQPSFILKYLSRDAYCRDDCRGLLDECKKLHAQALKLSETGNANIEGTSCLTQAGNTRLPSDWLESTTNWCKQFRGADSIISLCTKGIKDIQKLSIYESMRFCNMLKPNLPNGAVLEFKSGSGGNVNIQMYPAWASKQLTNMKGAFIFQLTPNGKTLGGVWLNVSEDKRDQHEPGSPLWKFYDIKLSMKSKLPNNPKIYEKEMPELLLSVVKQGINMYREAGLI